MSENKKKYLQKNHVNPSATHLASTSHEESCSFGMPILVSLNSQPLQCAMRTITEKLKILVSSEGSFGSMFSRKLKDFDSFYISKIPQVDTHSLSDSSKTL